MPLDLVNHGAGQGVRDGCASTATLQPFPGSYFCADPYAHKYGDPEWHWEPSHCRVAREANRPFSFNDESLRTTGVRAVTARELRARINGLRHGLDLAPFVWTNPTIDSGRTFIRVVHVMELRRALTQAYVAAAREPPTYTDDPIVAEVTPVSAEHFIELRAAVTALEQ